MYMKVPTKIEISVCVRGKQMHCLQSCFWSFTVTATIEVFIGGAKTSTLQNSVRREAQDEVALPMLLG